MTWRLYQQHTEPVVATAGPEVITVSKWYQPLTDPVRRIGITVALIASGAVISPWALTQAEAVTESRWHQSWSEPVRVKQGLSTWQQQALAAPVFVPTAETITADKWLYPLSEPVRFRRLPVALQQSIAFVKADPFPENVSVDRWLYRLSEPTRKKPNPPDTMAVFVPAPSETVTLDKWYAPFTTPTQRKSLHVSRQQTIGLGPYPITASISGWGYPFAEPVRKKRSIDIAAPFIPFVETTSPDKWFTPLSDPLRRKPRNEPPHPAFVSFISTEVVTIDKWYRDFGPPTRPKSYTASLSPYAFQSNYLVPAPYVDPPMASWSYSWSMPVRLRLGLSAANQSGPVAPLIPQPNPPTPTGVYTVSGLYVIDQFTDNTVVYDYSGGVSHQTN